LSLQADVGRNGRNHRADVARLEALLGATGYLDLEATEGPTGYFGKRTGDAVRRFQKDHDLRVDGEVKPNGETVRTLFRQAGVEKEDQSPGWHFEPGPIPEPGEPVDDMGESPPEEWWADLFGWIASRVPPTDLGFPGVGGIRG